MNFILMLLVMVLGVFFLKFPMIVIRMIALWSKFIFRNLFPGIKVHPALEEALYLIDHEPCRFAKRFPEQMIIMQISGIVALLIAITGFCIMVVTD